MTPEEKIEKTLRKKHYLHPSEKFSWEKYSQYVAIHCPEYFNTEKFNWEDYSWTIAEYCPEHF